MLNLLKLVLIGIYIDFIAVSFALFPLPNIADSNIIGVAIIIASCLECYSTKDGTNF